MAATYTARQALQLIQSQIKTPDISSIAHILLDESVQFIWNSYDWRGSMGELAPFYLIPQEQDYGPPLSAIPTDFHQLRSAFLRDVQGVRICDLHVVASLPRTERYDWPEDISYESQIAKFRVHPCPPNSLVASQYLIEGTYKKRTTKVTAANMNSLVLPWDDAYFGVFRKVFKWKLLDEIGNPNAGQITYLPNGAISANGAAAGALSAIMEMARREGVGDPPEQVAPETNLFM